MKDVLRYHAQDNKQECPISTFEDLLREPEYVPLTKNIDELFKDMQSKKLQMVIVVDEYGQTDGLIAMEDILEEIVGNIMDEDDVADMAKEALENGQNITGYLPFMDEDDVKDLLMMVIQNKNK